MLITTDQVLYSWVSWVERGTICVNTLPKDVILKCGQCWFRTHDPCIVNLIPYHFATEAYLFVYSLAMEPLKIHFELWNFWSLVQFFWDEMNQREQIWFKMNNVHMQISSFICLMLCHKRRIMAVYLPSEKECIRSTFIRMGGLHSTRMEFLSIKHEHLRKFFKQSSWLMDITIRHQLHNIHKLLSRSFGGNLWKSFPFWRIS